MSNPATIEDVVGRWRPLTEIESGVAEIRIEDAWRKLKRDVSDLETRMSSDVDLESEVIRVIADAVIRVLRSLERGSLKRGAIGVDDATTTWEAFDSDRAELYFTDSEYADVSASGRRKRARAFSVLPS